MEGHQGGEPADELRDHAELDEVKGLHVGQVPEIRSIKIIKISLLGFMLFFPFTITFFENSVKSTRKLLLEK